MAAVTTTLYGAVQLLPLAASAPLNEQLAWKTDVMISFNGTEERLQVRNSPRRRFDMVFPATQAEYQRGFNILYGERASLWAVPQWTEAQRIANVSGGAGSIVCNTTYYDFRTASLALLWSSPSDWEIVEVATVTPGSPGSLTLDGTTSGAFTTPWLLPVRIGHIVGTPTRITNSYNGDYKVAFELEDNISLVPSTPTQYLTDDIYYDEGLFAGSSFSDKITKRVDTVDEQLGIVAYRSPWTYSRVSRPFRWQLSTPQEVFEFREFLHRRAGRWRQFWMPSFDNDMRVVDTGAVTTVLTVETDDYEAHAADRTHIAVESPAGTWQPREITSTAPSGGNLELTLDSAINVDAGDIVRVSYLGLKRLEPDRVDIHWNGGGVADVEVRMLEISP